MDTVSLLSIRSKISLGIAAIIMIAFFSVQSCIVFGVCENTMNLAQFGYACVIAFMPPFFMVFSELLKNIRLKEENVNAQLEAISKSNLVVVMSIDGNIISANDNFCDIMGCPEKNIVNKHHSNMEGGGGRCRLPGKCLAKKNRASWPGIVIATVQNAKPNFNANSNC